MDTGARFPQMMCKPQAKKIALLNVWVNCLVRPSPFSAKELAALHFLSSLPCSHVLNLLLVFMGLGPWTTLANNSVHSVLLVLCCLLQILNSSFSFFFLSIVNFSYHLLLFWALPSPSDLVFGSSSDSGLLPVGSQQPPVLYIHPALVYVRACSVCHGFLCFSSRNGSYYSAP